MDRLEGTQGDSDTGDWQDEGFGVLPCKAHSRITCIQYMLHSIIWEPGLHWAHCAESWTPKGSASVVMVTDFWTEGAPGLGAMKGSSIC